MMPENDGKGKKNPWVEACKFTVMVKITHYSDLTWMCNAAKDIKLEKGCVKMRILVLVLLSRLTPPFWTRSPLKQGKNTWKKKHLNQNFESFYGFLSMFVDPILLFLFTSLRRLLSAIRADRFTPHLQPYIGWNRKSQWNVFVLVQALTTYPIFSQRYHDDTQSIGNPLTLFWGIRCWIDKQHDENSVVGGIRGWCVLKT